MHSWKKLFHYGEWSIKLKLVVISACLLFCSVSLVSLLSYIQYTRVISSLTFQKNRQVVNQLAYNINNYIDELFRLAKSPYYDTSVMNALEENPGKNEILFLKKSRTIENFLDEMMITPRDDILWVFLLSDSVYVGSREQADIGESVNFRKEGWYAKAMRNRDPVFIPVSRENLVKNQHYTVFSVVEQLRSTLYPDQIIGVIKVDANYEGIRSICSKVSMGSEGHLYLTDQKGDLIYSDSGQSASERETFIRRLGSVRGRQATLTIGGRQYLVNRAPIRQSNWNVVSVNSLGEINRGAAQTRNVAFLLAFLCAFLAIIVFILFSRQFLRPLFDVVSLMKKVESGDLSVKYESGANDEIGYLGTAFNTMITEINVIINQNELLLRQVYEARLLQNEAHFKELSSQIRPHFLYNALNTISLLIQCGRSEKAIDNINRLGVLLRSMLSLQSEIPLQKELALLDAYLGIQSSRFEGRLAFEIRIDPALLPYRIPALLLQPLAENSVVHGCEAKKGTTLVSVFDARENGRLTLVVQDNGAGILEEKLAAIREKLSLDETSPESPESPESGESIGIVNVDRRIKLRFGKQYGLRVSSRQGIGTRVECVLPAPEGKDGINS